MKAVILAGGLGTRISEESVLRPKPMIEIGGGDWAQDRIVPDTVRAVRPWQHVLEVAGSTG